MASFERSLVSNPIDFSTVLLPPPRGFSASLVVQPWLAIPFIRCLQASGIHVGWWVLLWPVDLHGRK